MLFEPIRKDIARRDLTDNQEFGNSNEPLEMHYLDKSTQKEMSLFSKKNHSYVDNRKVIIINNSVVVFKL